MESSGLSLPLPLEFMSRKFLLHIFITSCLQCLQCIMEHNRESNTADISPRLRNVTISNKLNDGNYFRLVFITASKIVMGRF